VLTVDNKVFRIRAHVDDVVLIKRTIIVKRFRQKLFQFGLSELISLLS